MFGECGNHYATRVDVCSVHPCYSILIRYQIRQGGVWLEASQQHPFGAYRIDSVTCGRRMVLRMVELVIKQRHHETSIASNDGT